VSIIDDLESLVVRRTIGLGDTIFALNAARAYKEQHPDTKVWFDFGNDERALLGAWLPMLEEPPAPLQAPVVDLDALPTDSSETRYSLMAERLGVQADELRLDWKPPEMLLAWYGADYPDLSRFVVLAPWCGGSAVTRSLTDTTIRSLLAQDEYWRKCWPSSGCRRRL